MERGSEFPHNFLTALPAGRADLSGFTPVRIVKIVVAVALVLGVLAVAGPFVYIHFIEGPAPKRLTLANSGTTTTVQPDAPVDGSWKATSDGTQAGYRTKEVLFGQDAEAVGRTDKVTGSMTIAGTKVNDASVIVDMASVHSDRSQRDGQFRGRIMDVSRFPTAQFVLTQPIDLGSAIPEVGKTVTVTAEGKLTLHGTTKPVTVPLSAVYDGRQITVNGNIPVKFPDYGIPDPTFGPATVQDHGEIEFLVHFVRA